MKLFVVLGSTPYEGSCFYAVRATRAEAEDDVALLNRVRAPGDMNRLWRSDYVEMLQRFGPDAYSSSEHEIREVEVPGVVSTAEADRMTAEAHRKAVEAWDRERDLRSIPG